MALSALATQIDVEDRLGRSLTADEAAKVTALLTDASAKARAYTRQDFTTATTTQVLRLVAGKVTLPQRPVTAITSVSLVGYDGVSRYPVVWSWDGLDTVTMLPDGVVLNIPEVSKDYPTDTVEVTWAHGYNTIPDDVVGVVATMVARVFGSPLVAGANFAAVGPFSYRMSNGYGVLTLTGDDELVLNRYGRKAVAVPLL